jgi:hypothetical protein
LEWEPGVHDTWGWDRVSVALFGVNTNIEATPTTKAFYAGLNLRVEFELAEQSIVRQGFGGVGQWSEAWNGMRR